MSGPGPWIQPPDHEFDYYAATVAGYGDNPEAYDPHFAYLPTSIGSPGFGGGGYHSLSGYRKFVDFRPRGALAPFAMWESRIDTGQNPQVNSPSDMTTPTTAGQLILDEWARIWAHVRNWESGELTGGFDYFNPVPTWPDPGTQIPMTWGSATADYAFGTTGAAIYLDNDRWGNVPRLTNVRAWQYFALHYYAADETHLLMYRPEPEQIPNGAYLEWEGPATVVGAQIYIKIAVQSNPIYLGGTEDALQDGGIRWARYSSNPSTGFEGFGAHAPITCHGVLRHAPTPARGLQVSDRTYRMEPMPEILDTYATLPVLYDGPNITDEPLLLDVTDYLDGSDGNSFSMLVHVGELQTSGVLPRIVPDGYDMGNAYDGGLIADTREWFAALQTSNDHNAPHGVSPSPYMVWTIRPPRYRFVYNDAYSHPNIAGVQRGGGANFVAAK